MDNIKKSFVFRESILLLFLLLSVSTLYSQTLQNNFVHFTQREGLPSDEANAIIQDHLGYIWIGTNNGLSRYDGYEFYNFSVVKDDSNFLQLPLVTSLFEDSNTNIWIGAIGGISKYDREEGTFKLYTFRDYEKEEERTFLVTDICETMNGDILIGIADMFYSDINIGLYLIKNGSNKVDKVNSNNDSTDVIVGISPIDNDRYFIFGRKGFAEYNHQDKYISWYPIGDDEVVTTLLQDDNQMVWLGILNTGFYHYNTKEKNYEIIPIPNNFEIDDDFLVITDMMFDQNKDLLITTNRGLAQFNRKSKKITYAKFDITNPSALHSNDLNNIMKDKTGSIWIGSDDAGISRYNTVQNNFQSFYNNPNDPNSLEPGWVSTMFEYDNNELWFQSTRNSISKLNRKKEIFSNVKLPVEAFYFYRDKAKQIWLAVFGDLYKLNVENWSVKNVDFPVNMENNVIHVLLEDSKNTFWVGTHSGLITYDRQNNLAAKIDFANLGIGSSQSNQIFNLVEDSNNNVWIGSNNGLFMYSNINREYTRVGTSADSTKSLNSQDVNSLYVDTYGNVWVGTWLGGLNKLDPKTGIIESYTKNEGFNSHSVQGILGDEENGALWLSSFDGISRFDIEQEKFHEFGIDDGVQGNQFAQSSALKTSDGLFIFGGQNGVTMFKPENIKSDLASPFVQITDLKIFNESIKAGENNILEQPIYKTKSIQLNYDDNDISFDFIAVHYANPKKNKYAYRLINYADEWRYVGNQRTAIYPNLPPGEYVFQVKAANNNGVWNEEGKSINITILPPWWKTTLAYLSYGFIFIGLIFGVDRFQRRRLLTKAKERMKMQEAEHRAEAAELQARAVQAENDRKSKELEEARQLQLSMLPKELPQIPNLDIAVYMKTATEVGGDYYDFNVSIDGTLTVVLGDATGHGMKAGTMVTAAKSLFNSYAPNLDILYTFQEMTRCIKQMNMNNLSMCLTMLKIHGNKMTMSSAGMPPVYIFKNDVKNVEEHLMKGMPLGTMTKFPYELKKTKLGKGDTILLMSDGLPELQNDKNEMYGYDRTKTEFHSAGRKEPEEIVDHLMKAASQWVDGKDPDDDVTFVVIKIK